MDQNGFFSDSSELDLKEVICADQVGIVNGREYVELFGPDYHSKDEDKIDGISSSYNPSISSISETEKSQEKAEEDTT